MHNILHYREWQGGQRSICKCSNVIAVVLSWRKQKWLTLALNSDKLCCSSDQQSWMDGVLTWELHITEQGMWSRIWIQTASRENIIISTVICNASSSYSVEHNKMLSVMNYGLLCDVREKKCRSLPCNMHRPVAGCKYVTVIKIHNYRSIVTPEQRSLFHLISRR